MYWLGKNLKLWGSIIMQNESFWSFPILFEYYIIQETIFPHLINLLLKTFGEIRCNKCNYSGHPTNVKDTV